MPRRPFHTPARFGEAINTRRQQIAAEVERRRESVQQSTRTELTWRSPFADDEATVTLSTSDGWLTYFSDSVNYITISAGPHALLGEWKIESEPAPYNNRYDGKFTECLCRVTQLLNSGCSCGALSRAQKAAALTAVKASCMGLRHFNPGKDD